MTTFSFFLIYFIITCCVGIAIAVIGTKLDSESQTAIGYLMGAISIGAITITLLEHSQTLVPNHVWLLYIIPALFLFIALFELITDKYTVDWYWDREFYEKYKLVKSNYENLQKKLNHLEKQLEKEKETHEKEIQNLLKRKPLEVKQSNIKLHL